MIKRKLLLIMGLMVLFAVPAFAQFYFGGEVPLGYITADLDTVDSDRFAVGLYGKAGFKFGVFALEGKAGYLSHMYKTEIAGETITGGLNYLRFAALGKIYPVSILYVGAGVEFSYLVGYTVSTVNETYTETIERQDGPIYFTTNAGVEIPIGKHLYLPLGGFFNYAIANIEDNWKIMELGVTAGIQYRY